MTRHGHASPRSPTYRTWHGLRHRHKLAKYAGVTVCERWASFKNFLVDMGERPDGTTLDRWDNALGYAPGNCRWATPREQTRNRGATKLTLPPAIDAVRAVQAGEQVTAVAARYGVSVAAISKIVHGHRWPEARELASRALITTEQ